mmetsp:Transcript_81464/g.239229  ORF Transcript_81464/g.239229 Transcript_81464/m.239229 type:complete len:246 (+) Transcript_81464:1477-2214(+)
MPRYARTSQSRTPVQTLLATAAAPQLKPMVFFVMFCSLRRLPAQMKVTGMLTTGPTLPEVRSSMLSSQSPRGPPLSFSRCVSHVSFGTAPWFRTTCRDAGVTQPASWSRRSGGSELNGWRPVSRTISGRRFTQPSGVSRSRSSTSLASCFSGTSMRVAQRCVESRILPSTILPSQAGSTSLLPPPMPKGESLAVVSPGLSEPPSEAVVGVPTATTGAASPFPFMMESTFRRMSVISDSMVCCMNL